MELNNNLNITTIDQLLFVQNQKYKFHIKIGMNFLYN